MDDSNRLITGQCSWTMQQTSQQSWCFLAVTVQWEEAISSKFASYEA